MAPLIIASASAASIIDPIDWSGLDQGFLVTGLIIGKRYKLVINTRFSFSVDESQADPLLTLSEGVNGVYQAFQKFDPQFKNNNTHNQLEVDFVANRSQFLARYVDTRGVDESEQPIWYAFFTFQLLQLD
jgi:hypothetical protein